MNTSKLMVGVDAERSRHGGVQTHQRLHVVVLVTVEDTTTEDTAVTVTANRMGGDSG